MREESGGVPVQKDVLVDTSVRIDFPSGPPLVCRLTENRHPAVAAAPWALTLKG